MSNLPPGVTESQLPGNRPEDQAFDSIVDGPVGDWLQDHAQDVAQVDQTELVAVLQNYLDRQQFCALCGAWIDPRRQRPVIPDDLEAVFCSRKCADGGRAMETGGTS